MAWVRQGCRCRYAWDALESEGVCDGKCNLGGDDKQQDKVD